MIFATALTTFLVATTALALNNDFGRTPVMGFNTYNDVACTINTSYVDTTIQAFATKGFPALGYKFFQLDCGWQGLKRQRNGAINFDAGAFKTGILPLSKKANSLGMHWSMYTDQGLYACDKRTDAQGQRPGSLHHEVADARQLAAWNVVYMKVDNCYIDGLKNVADKSDRTDFPQRFGAWSKAQQAAGIKGMLVCQWGVPYSSPSGRQGPAEWTPSLANSYRVSDDIAQGWNNVMRIMNQAINVNLRGLNGPGHFADMDLLEVGNPGMTVAEQASHFAIWAMFKSALMISTGIPSMSRSTFQILSNKDLIAINQDPLGRPVTLVQRYTNDKDIYAGPLSTGSRAVLVLDQSNRARMLSIDFRVLGIKSANVKNLWTGAVVNNVGTYTARTDAHGTLALRLDKIVKLPPSSPRLNYVEAESGQLSGGANKQGCPGCSGGNKVGFVGTGGGTLTLSGIRTSQAIQDVRFDYVLCDIGYLGAQGPANVRGASISVNGGKAQPVLFPLSGYNWDKDVMKGFLVRLGGFSTTRPNTIKISGLAGSTPFAPDFDRIGFVA